MNTQWHLEQVLAAWITGVERPEAVRVLVPAAVGNGPAPSEHVEIWPFAAVLFELWNDTTYLPEEAGQVLHTPPMASYAHAARLLWCIRNDDLFPARTHAEAVTYLASLPRDVLASYHRAVEQAIERNLPSPWPAPAAGSPSPTLSVVDDVDVARKVSQGHDGSP